MAEEATATTNEGFEGYEETTVDPGPWLLLSTTVFCFGVMLVVVPLLVWWKVKRRNQKADNEALVGDGKIPVDTGIVSILRFTPETFKILKLAVPYSISALSSSSFSNLCLIFVSHHIGTKAVAAYALVEMLVGLSDGVLYGPIYACTTLCAHAVGAGNNELAGTYIQLAIVFYLLMNIPQALFWCNYMYDAIMFLEWGDQETAQLAQDFIRVYIGSYILGGISSAVWQLLEVADHAVAGTIISILWSATNALLVGALLMSSEATLVDVGWIYNLTALLFVGITVIIGHVKGWFKPFLRGLVGFSLFNISAIKLLVSQSIPLMFGSLFSEAEWAVLTFFASYLGPAEVATWAILGSIWDVFYSVNTGIGDAAEIRVAYHLGDGHATMAKLSAYKALFLGMVVASCVSITYFSLQDSIPGWFTSDPTLQGMLAELVPFVGVANLTMTFGSQCWSLIGAQGRYKLATWISFISSWGIAMPMAATYVYALNIDLQGLTSAVVIGYVSSGAALSFTLLSTDWRATAKKIQEENADIASGNHTSGNEDEMYASLKYNSYAAKSRARRNIRMITLPPGQRSGLMLGNIHGKKGTYVLLVRNWSPLYGRVNPGDCVLAIDSVDVTKESAASIADRLKTAKMFDRTVSISAPPAEVENDAEEPLIYEVGEDESSDAGSLPKANLF